MNQLISANGPAITMTSLELVQFINNQRDVGAAELAHSDFLKKVPQVLGGGAGNFSDTYVHAQNGQTYPCYRFPKREACLMAMSYSYDLQAKVFDRMSELEGQASDPMRVLADPAAMRTLLLGYSEKVLALEDQVGKLEPKAQALERIADSDGLMNPTGAAKALQVQPKRIFDYLRTNAWVYRRAGGRSDVAYQDKIAAGLLTHKVHVARREDGSERMCEQVMVTPKGLARLAQAFGAH